MIEFTLLILLIALFFAIGVTAIALICRIVYSMGIPEKLDKVFRHKEE